MSQQRYQHGFTTGRCLWLVIAVALGVVSAVAAGLTLGSQAAVAKECQRETPLPADLRQVGCGPQAGGPPPAPDATGRVHNAYFMPVGQDAPAVHAFKGTLTVPSSTLFRARYGCAGLAEMLSGFSVAFFTHGEHLVPLTAIILSSGRVWSEPGDGGLSRASFPFVVTNPYFNRTHNGMATFLYDDTRVSA